MGTVQSLTRTQSFLSPVGDYYTVTPLTMEKAHELSLFGFRRVIVPAYVGHSDAEAYLVEEGVEVVRVWIGDQIES